MATLSGGEMGLAQRGTTTERSHDAINDHEKRPSGGPEPIQDPEPRQGQEASPSARPVSTVLWIILGISVAFLVLVQFLVDRLEGPPIPEAGLVAETPVMTTHSPLSPAFPRELVLGWREVSGATIYHLKITGPDGSPVVDPLPVLGTRWTPDAQVIPGLGTGDHTWSVEALDSSGTILARSLVGRFSIR